MAIRTREEIMTALNNRLGDDHSDEALALVEDITDTLESLAGNSGGVDWEQRYKENDQAWREKYRNRFFGKINDNDDDNYDNDNPNKSKPKPRTFADLFKR